MEVVSTFPQLGSSSITPCMLHWNVTSGIITFSLCCIGVIFGQFSLLINYFCQLSQRFITGKQGGNTTPCFAVCLWTNRCAVTNHHAYMSFTQWSVTVELAAETCTRILTVYCDNWNLNPVVRELKLFNESVVTEIIVCWKPCKARTAFISDIVGHIVCSDYSTLSL